MRMENRLLSYSISFLCSMGLFLAGYLFYSSALIESYYAYDFNLTKWQIGIAQSTIPLGAILGAVLAGWLADLFGRNRLLAANFLMLIYGGIFAAFVTDFYSLSLSRFINGFLAGMLYPLCAAYLVEMTSHQGVSRQTAGLMFINCLAAPFACVASILLSLALTDHQLWRVLASLQTLPAFIAYVLVRTLPESEIWIEVSLKKAPGKRHPLRQLITLFNPHYRVITFYLIGVWFLMDIAYYGINFFVPYLLGIMDVNQVVKQQSVINSLVINIFFMFGALAAIFVIERVDLYRLQSYGFLFASASMLTLAFFCALGIHQLYLVVILFIIFNFSINIGPDVTTYLLSATSYPVEIRASGHGMIAGFAKIGSFLGVLLMPTLQASFGHGRVVVMLSFILFVAYYLTAQLAKKSTNELALLEEELNYESC